MNDDLPPLPEPAFRLLWKYGAYKVTKPNIGDTDVYTADQLRAAVLAERERCARVCDDLEKEWKQLARGRLDSHYNDMQTAAERLAYAIRKGAS